MKKGFTLIELMIVISIIGLLSSIVLASLATAKEKARVAQVQQETLQLQNALELYKASGSYPTATARADQSPSEWSVFVNALQPYINVNSLSFTKLTNLHYFPYGGAYADTYNTCGGVVLKPGGYIVIFYMPLPLSTAFKIEPVSGYYCFINS